jgi:hypothetical protein
MGRATRRWVVSTLLHDLLWLAGVLGFWILVTEAVEWALRALFHRGNSPRR